MAWYVVSVGRQTGVYSTWEACHDQVNGFKGACYKKYKTKDEAMEAFHGAKFQPTDLPAQPRTIINNAQWDCKYMFMLLEALIILVQAVIIVVLVSKSK